MLKMRIIFIVGMVSLVLLSGGIVLRGQDDINSLVNKGVEQYKQENYKSAYDFFRQAMKMEPNHPQASQWYWKMKSEHDVKNLKDKGPIEQKREAVAEKKTEPEQKTQIQAAVLTEKKAEEAKTAENHAAARDGKKSAVQLEEDKQQVAAEKKAEPVRHIEKQVRFINLSGAERAAYLKRMNEIEGGLARRILELNRQIVILKEELEKKKAPEREITAEEPPRTARPRDAEHGSTAWFMYGNYIPIALFLLSFVLLVFTLYGITWSRRRNRLIPAPPQPAPAGVPSGQVSGAGSAISATDNRAMVMELARKFMNSPDKDMNVVAPLLSHLIKSDGKVGMEEMLKTMPYLEEKVFGSHVDGGLNNNLEVFANSFLFLMEKKLKRGNEALKVKTLCSETGLRLGLSQNEIQELRLAALIRDTGFLVVSQKLLLKKGPLTAREEQEMRKHVIYSAKIAQFMSLPERVINVIRNHHERFDGSGYPYGSSGEEIPFMARIVAPCDSYVSLTSLRPYRRSLTSDQAIKKLQAEAGLFDPAVFKAFEDVIHSKLFLKENMLEPEIA